MKPCRSVHTIGMRFAIDAAFVDENNIICHLVENMGPYKVSPLVRNACYVIEAPAGTMAEAHTRVGDKVAVL